MCRKNGFRDLSGNRINSPCRYNLRPTDRQPRGLLLGSVAIEGPPVSIAGFAKNRIQRGHAGSVLKLP